jgi:hypothetical protein
MERREKEFLDQSETEEKKNFETKFFSQDVGGGKVGGWGGEEVGGWAVRRVDGGRLGQ